MSRTATALQINVELDKLDDTKTHDWLACGDAIRAVLRNHGVGRISYQIVNYDQETYPNG